MPLARLKLTVRSSDEGISSAKSYRSFLSRPPNPQSCHHTLPAGLQPIQKCVRARINPVSVTSSCLRRYVGLVIGESFRRAPGTYTYNPCYLAWQPFLEALPQGAFDTIEWGNDENGVSHSAIRYFVILAAVAVLQWSNAVFTSSAALELGWFNLGAACPRSAQRTHRPVIRMTKDLCSLDKVSRNHGASSLAETATEAPRS